MPHVIEVVNTRYAVAWLPWAVEYFFLIGISAGAFFLSVPGIALQRREWHAISRVALLIAVVCALTAPLALLSDLHQPGRFLNFYLHSHFTSWMAWGAYFIPLYVLALLAYGSLAVMSRSGQRRNVKAAAWVTAVGAVLLLLYSGMEVAIVRSRPLWHTPLLPLLFALTAFSAAIGVTQILGVILRIVDEDAVRRMKRVLAAAQIVTLVLVAIWVALGTTALSSAHAEAWRQLTSLPVWYELATVIVAMMVITLVAAFVPSRYGLIGALCAVATAWLVRWMVLIEGQTVSKIGPRFDPYHLPLGIDGVIGMIGIAGLWVSLFVLLMTFVRFDHPQAVEGA